MKLSSWFWLSEYTEEEVDGFLDLAVRAGLDNVIFYVGGGAVDYPSELLPQSGAVTDSPLAMVLEKAHGLGLTVEAWWAVGFTERNSTFRQWYPHLDIAIHPEVPDTCHWLNFSLPEAQQLVANVAIELAQQGVDAVHLDYIRYTFPGIYAEQGCQGWDCSTVFSKDDISGTVATVYEQLKQDHPEVLLTAAVLPGLTADTQSLQYWNEWLAGEYIDVCYPMAYVEPENISRYDYYIPYWQAMAHQERINPAFEIWLSGYPTYEMKAAADLQVEVELCQAAGYQDFCFFNLRFNDEQLAYIRSLKDMAEIPEHPRSAQDILDDIRLGNQSSQGELAIVQGDADTLIADIAALTDRYIAQEALIAELEAQLAAITGEVAG